MASLREFPWKDRLRRAWQVFVERSRQSASHLPTLRRKPSLALDIVKTAFLFHFALIATVLILIFVAPPVVRGVANIIHPNSTGPLGLIRQEREEAKSLRRAIMTMLWLGSGSGCLVILWLHVPAGMVQATRRRERSERKADSLRQLDPEKSAILYRSALALATDPREERELEEKLRIAKSQSAELGHTVVTPRAPQREGLWTRAGKLLKSMPAATSSKFAVGVGGRYRLDRPLGQGGMGTVYIGYDTQLGRKVAVKGLPEGPAQGQDFTSRFHQEAKALAALCHPGIVQIYDFVAEAGRVWIVLEYVEGGDLSAYLREHGPLGIAEAARLASLCAEALGHAHERGVVHRDFKPANVLLTVNRAPKITDFGLARLMGGSALTRTGTILGSAPYMSPEQASGKPAEANADVYSLGITLYEMVAGVTPFTGDPASVLAQHLTQPPPPLLAKRPDAPPALGELIDRMLVKDPGQRLSDLGAVSAALWSLSAPAPPAEVAPA